MKTLIYTQDGRVGTLTHLDSEFVFGIFTEKRADGSICIGEECYLTNEVRLVRDPGKGGGAK